MISLIDFDDLIARRSMLTHPFYKVWWSEGKLTRDQLATYAKEYYHLVKAIPAIVSHVHRHAVLRRPDLADAIAHNIVEEQEHIALWERFAASLGVDRSTMQSVVASPMMQTAIARLQYLAESGFEQGVAAMYAMEREIPAVAQSKKEGLLHFYGLSSDDAHAYFDEHLHEQDHFSLWQKIPIGEELGLRCVQASLDAQHALLDAVCDACGIDCDCMVRRERRSVLQSPT